MGVNKLLTKPNKFDYLILAVDDTLFNLNILKKYLSSKP